MTRLFVSVHNVGMGYTHNTTTSPNLDRIDELAQRAIYAAHDLGWTLQFRADADHRDAVADALRRFDSATAALTAYANGVLDARGAVAS